MDVLHKFCWGQNHPPSSSPKECSDTWIFDCWYEITRMNWTHHHLPQKECSDTREHLVAGTKCEGWIGLTITSLAMNAWRGCFCQSASKLNSEDKLNFFCMWQLWRSETAGGLLTIWLRLHVGSVRKGWFSSACTDWSNRLQSMAHGLL